MTEEKRKLYVPTKIILEKEIFEGLSIRATAISGVILLIFFVLGLIISNIYQLNAVTVLWMAAIPTAISAGVQWKYDGGLNMVEYIRLLVNFNVTQKRYYFSYVEEE